MRSEEICAFNLHSETHAVIRRHTNCKHTCEYDLNVITVSDGTSCPSLSHTRGACNFSFSLLILHFPYSLYIPFPTFWAGGLAGCYGALEVCEANNLNRFEYN